jgi:hypothetical protein
MLAVNSFPDDAEGREHFLQEFGYDPEEFLTKHLTIEELIAIAKDPEIGITFDEDPNYDEYRDTDDREGLGSLIEAEFAHDYDRLIRAVRHVRGE